MSDAVEFPHPIDVLVVGAGLAGLAAAAFAAREGARVLLLERAESAGGRAATHEHSGFCFNLGPHALYADAHADAVLRELGVSYSARRPSSVGRLAYDRGHLHALPGGFVSLLTTSLLPLAGKLELAELLSALGKLDPDVLRGRSVREWTLSAMRNDSVRALVEALVRLTSYANAPAYADAGAHLKQLQLGLGLGVYYVDGGWTTLVNGLAGAATDAGARIRCNARVRGVSDSTNGSWEVRTHERVYRTERLVLALPPAASAALVKDVPCLTELRSELAGLRPVKASCLDLGLRALPNPRALFALGIDRPLYFSVHSASARLAPAGAATIHAARYLGAEEDFRSVEAELEALCDRLQPGWRSLVVERRFLPAMMVTGALCETGRARPSVEVAGVRGLYLAGDWVGTEGMLADAALASGRRAGRLAGKASRAARARAA